MIGSASEMHDVEGQDEQIAEVSRGCVELWADVLRLGILDLHGRGRQLSPKQRRTASKAAAAWVRSDSREVGSFTWLCILFDFDADSIRAAVLPAAAGTKRTRA